MKSNELRICMREIMEKHMPYYFFDDELKSKFLDAVSSAELSRREVLILAYWAGASIDEANSLLRITKHPLLYIKKWEDVIWKFMLKEQKDINFIMNEIFPQNEDDM